jgi:Domain of unknown function (DUF5667)
MTKRERQFSDLLQQELEGLGLEGQSLDPALEPSPDQIEVLTPALEAARWLQARRAMLEPRAGFLAAGRRRLQAQIQAGVPLDPGRAAARSFSWTRQGIQFVLVCLLFLSGFLAANSLYAASPTWLPGDPTYFLKLAQEDLSLQLAASPARRASLHIEYAHRRMLEAQALVFEGRYDRLPLTVENFSGHVDSAVSEIRLAAARDPNQAAGLAGGFERTLAGQQDLFSLIASATPNPARLEFLHLMEVSRLGLADLQEFQGGGS